MDAYWRSVELEEELQERQADAKEKLSLLKQLMVEEKQRLNIFKEHLNMEKGQYLKMVEEIYKEPEPCPCQEKPPTTFKENMGEYTVCVSKKENCETEDDEKLIKMEWTDEQQDAKNPQAGQNDTMLVQFEKQLDEDMLLKMQMQAKGKPRKVCPCRAKKDGVIQPFPPSPHSHTTYFKTELIVADVKNNHDFKTTCKMTRTDKIRNMNDPQVFSVASTCNT